MHFPLFERVITCSCYHDAHTALKLIIFLIIKFCLDKYFPYLRILLKFCIKFKATLFFCLSQSFLLNFEIKLLSFTFIYPLQKI